MVENTSNLYFRIGLTGSYPDAGINGTVAPRYGKVVVTHPGGSQTIYIRQGEVAAELVPGSGVYWSPYNMSDPERGEGGNNIADHNDVRTDEAVFLPEKFTGYPSQGGYFFQWNRVKAYHPIAPYTSFGSSSRLISGWPFDYENTWDTTRDVCPIGYRHPKGKSDDPASEYLTGLLGDTPGTDNSMWGYYADGFFDRSYLQASLDIDEMSRAGSGSEIAYLGRLFFNTGSSASLFFPAGGQRYSWSDSNKGYLSGEGTSCFYFYGDKSDDGNNFRYVRNAYFSETRVEIIGGIKTTGYKIRCVKGEKQ